MANHEIETPSAICAVCGGIEEDEYGLCLYGHDNWMEITEGGILPDQAVLFEKNLGIPVMTAIKALQGDKTQLSIIIEAHKKFIKNNGQPRN